MKITINGYEAGPPGGKFLVLTTPCPFNTVWVEGRMAGSIACSECPYFDGSSDNVVYCKRGNKKYKTEEQ